MGVDFAIVAPEALWPTKELIALCQGYAKESGSSITVTDDVNGVEGADVLYTDVWASMGEEDKAAERIAMLKPYQIPGADGADRQGYHHLHALSAGGEGK